MKDTKPKEEIVTQCLEKKDLGRIKSLYFQRMGWSHLLQATVAHKAAGFPCEIEELIVNRMAQKAQYAMNEWFSSTSRRNNWLSKDGHFWNVDFASGSVTLRQPEKHIGPKDITTAEMTSGQPVMGMGDIDIDVFSRLVERRDFIADCIRPNLQPFLKGNFPEDQINAMAQELGESIQDTLEWFTEMGKTYKWPALPDKDWFYFADTVNKQILMVRSGYNPSI